VKEAEILARSSALWNRRGLDLQSPGTLAQILDRGSVDDWRALYSLAAQDPALRARIHAVVRTIPVWLPGFWLAALESLGESVDYEAPVPAEVDPA
jgi:hypothetical protein